MQKQSAPPSSVMMVHGGTTSTLPPSLPRRKTTAVATATTTSTPNESQSLPQSSTAWKAATENDSLLRGRRLSSTNTIVPPRGRRTSSVEMADVYKRQEETIFEMANPLNTPNSIASTSTSTSTVPPIIGMSSHSTSTAVMDSLAKFDGSITSKEFLARKSIRHHGTPGSNGSSPRRASLFDVVRDASSNGGASSTDDDRSSYYPNTSVSPRSNASPPSVTTTTTVITARPSQIIGSNHELTTGVHATPIQQQCTKVPAPSPQQPTTLSLSLDAKSPPPLPTRPLNKRRPESIQVQQNDTTKSFPSAPLPPPRVGNTTSSGEVSPTIPDGSRIKNNRKSSLLLGKIFSSPLWDKRKSVTAHPPSPLQLTTDPPPVIVGASMKRASIGGENINKRTSINATTVESMLLSTDTDDDTFRAQSVARVNLRQRRAGQRARYLARKAAEQAELEGKTISRKPSSFKDKKGQNIKELSRFFQRMEKLHKRHFLLPTSKDANLQYCDKRATFLLNKYSVEELIEPLIRLYHTLPDRWESYHSELEDFDFVTGGTKRSKQLQKDRGSVILDEDSLAKNLALMGEYDVAYTRQINRFSNAQIRQEQRTQQGGRNDDGLLSHPPDI